MSEWVERHQSCEECGSSDGRSVNSDGWSTCFVCDHRFKQSGDSMPPVQKQMSDTQRTDKGISTATATLLANVKPQPIDDRCLTAATVAKFGVVVQGERHIYPYYGVEDSTVPLAAKKRLPGKAFPSEGALNECRLFGQQIFNSGGRNIVLTEGETDAMAVYQLQGNKYPSVSVTNSGAALKDCKRNYEWLDSFDEVIVCFDNDDAGKKAAKQVADLFSGKSKVMNLGDYNDPVDMMRDGARGREAWKNSFWGAESYEPAGIVAGTDTWKHVIAHRELETIPYPWEGLNDMTRGIVTPSLVTLTSGSGMGKTQLMKELQYWLLNTTDAQLGIIPLEESVAIATLSLMSIHTNKLLQYDKEISEESLQEIWQSVMGDGRIFMLDHFGSTSIDSITAKIRYLAKARDCKFIFLDHLSIIVSAQESGDERKSIDAIMTRLRKLCEEAGITIFLVSHLSRSNGVAHEEGGRVTLGQLRGSQSIAQLSDIVIAAERDQQADCPVERSTTKLRIIKNRTTGKTGVAAHLKYDDVTGRLEEVEPIEVDIL